MILLESQEFRMEPISLFPSPPPSLRYTPPLPPPPSKKSDWTSYWILFLWYITQGGRMAMSLGIASVVWIAFSLLPGVLAWIITYKKRLNFNESHPIYEIREHGI